MKTTEEIKTIYTRHTFSEEATNLIDAHKRSWAGFLDGYRAAEAEACAEIERLRGARDHLQFLYCEESISHEDATARAETAEARAKELEQALRERGGSYYQRNVPHQSQHPHCQCRECVDSRCNSVLANALTKDPT